MKKFLTSVCFILAGILMVAAPQIQAFTQNDIDCTNHTTCFYEPCSTPSSSPTGGGGTTPTSPAGQTTGPPKAVQKVVWDTLIDGGLDPVHAAAVMGNIAHEGGFIPGNDSENPDATNPTSKNPADANPYGYGLIGWTPGSDLSKTTGTSSLTYQMRELGMLSVDSHGNIQYSAQYPPYTAETQAAVILAQIQGKTAAYPASVGQGFLATKNVKDAADYYEGPGGFENPLNPDESRQKRENSAQHFLDLYGGTSPTSPTGGGTGGGGSSCCPTAGSSSASAANVDDTNVNDVYILGDSITERTSDTYKQVFQQAGATTVDIDASSSRGINTPGTDGNQLSGLDAINHDQDEIQNADTIVIALGTNGGATTQDIDKVTNAIQNINPNASVYWVNVISVGRSDNFNQTVTAPTNQAIQQEAQTDGYQVINWFKKVDPSGSPTSPTKSEKDPNSYIDNSDGLGVHPTAQGSQALASLVVSQTGADQNSASGSGSSSSQCCGSGTGSPVNFPPGTLPSSVPEPYNRIFTAAANKANIEPALLAGIFYGGEHANSWPDPPPPYGHGSTWASSGVPSLGAADWPTQPPGPGAAGPFQFEYPTWQSYKQDGNGDGKEDVEDLTDAAFGAAAYLAASGGKLPSPDINSAILAYNHSTDYLNSVTAAYDKFGGGSSGTTGTASPGTTTGSPGTTGSTGSTPSTGPDYTVSGGGGACGGSGTASGTYENPLRDVKDLVALRIDEGVDYSGDGPVYALGDGVVTFSGNGYWFGSSGDYYGPSVVYKLTDGPAQGKSVYFAENVTPKVKAGDNVTSSTVIADMINASPNIETGWAEGGSNQDEPMAGPDYAPHVPDGSKMAYGVNFNELLVSLGAPAGNSNPSISISWNPGVTVGSLESGWPTWPSSSSSGSD